MEVEENKRMSPLKPRVACKFPLCPELLDSPGYCKKHRALMGYVSDQWHYLYNNQRWRKYSKGYLNKHPLCHQCKQENQIAPSDVVDHIVPHRGDRKLFWDSENHQALCNTCHHVKTGKESDWGG
jgi:5-methylcytosine-specific restriction protein A